MSPMTPSLTLRRELNGHTLQLGRILTLGEEHNHWDRFKSALVNKFGHIPTLFGFLKDHKPSTPGMPRKMRPVAGASEAPNSQLCHLLATIVRGLSGTMEEKLETVCRSTEEMIARIEEVNQKLGTKVPVIFSTDVEAMYPSLDIPVIAQAAKEQFLRSDLEIPINAEELSLYCAIVLSKEEIAELGITDVCHTRARAGGRRPGITTQEVTGRTEKNKDGSLFVKPKRKPNQNEVRIMFAEALRILIDTAMSNHIYTWDKTIRKQSRGGAIGSDLTRELGVFIMLVWTSSFKDRVKEATAGIPDWEMHMLQFYIDDGNMITDPLPPGSRLIDQIIVIAEEEVDRDRDTPADERTAKILTEIGNRIFNFIRLTCDYPSAHPSGLRPILDIQTRVEDGQITYRFYKKVVAIPLLLRASSAMPLKMKRTSDRTFLRSRMVIKGLHKQIGFKF